MNSSETLPKEHPMATESCVSLTETLPRYEPGNDSDVSETGAVAILLPEKCPTATAGILNTFMWTENSFAITNVILASLGPLRYHLSFRDAFLCGFAGLTLGSFPVAFISTFAPILGRRALNRHAVGRVPARVLAFLNCTTTLGLLVIELIAAGQILSAIVALAVFPTSIAIVTSACITGIKLVLGVKKIYPDYTLCAQIVAVFILSSVVTSQPVHPTMSVSLSLVGAKDKLSLGHRISFFNLCLARAILYSPFATSIGNYDGKSNKSGLIFLQTLIGMLLSFAFTFVVGAGLGAKADTIATWREAYEGSIGTLIAEVLHPTGMMLKSSCGIVLVLGIMINMIRSMYSILADLYDLSSRLESVPMPIYPTMIMPICVTFAVLGRNHLADIMISVYSMTGYFASIWFGVLLTEYILFNKCMGHNNKWLLQEDERQFPLGLASSATFLLSCTVVVLCMTQTWYIGPIGFFFKSSGLDLAILIGFIASVILYLILRYVELRFIERHRFSVAEDSS
ncbi:hypothetical protein KCU99_g9457, partial [Aureobasidium melanogenum]